MLTITRLKASEYGQLANIDDGFTPHPRKSVVVVAKEGSRCIGRIMLVAPVHVEGVFIEPEFRNGTLMKQLVDAVEVEARVEGIKRCMPMQ